MILQYMHMCFSACVLLSNAYGKDKQEINLLCSCGILAFLDLLEVTCMFIFILVTSNMESHVSSKI